MPNTFELIASNTVGSGGAATVTFSSIPSTYTDLCLKGSIRWEGNVNFCYISFNGSSANFTERRLYGTGSAVGSQSDTGNNALLGVADSNTADTFSNGEIYIPNYAGSTNKSFSIDTVQENNATAAFAFMIAGLWSDTSAITSITLTPDTYDFAQYSSFYLYGVKNA